MNPHPLRARTLKTITKKRLLFSLFAFSLTTVACAGRPPAVEVLETRSSEWDGHERLTAEVDPEAFDEAAARAAIFHATNEQRRAHGLGELRRERLLDVSSQMHAERMRRHEFIAHDDPYSARHRTPVDRARLAGVSNPYTAENIATRATIEYDGGVKVYVVPGVRGGFSVTPGGKKLPRHTYVTLARELLRGWMNSPGHRKNVLHVDAVSLGAGAAFFWQDDFPAVYAVQNFQFFEQVIPSE